ncbi:universal stress protein [Nonomuraea sp. FMUSA5-5]|uniref:Universal stress protein n=2 Tax=Nonomuraea composti TaxID=2720023 RepID=A0ABX1BB15_9ACTN|nr:universal stress protein [Nonomuraea sp. FMUSA5-5]
MIIVGADGSVASRAAVEWAAGDAARRRVPLRVVHVADTSWYQVGKPPGAGLPDLLLRAGRQVLDEAEALVRERQPAVEVTTRQVAGRPAEVLAEQAGDATALVVGSRGLGGFAGALLGSVSMHLAGHVHCPVVVVRGAHLPAGEEVVVGVDDSPECEPALAYAYEQALLRGATLRVVHAWQLPVHAYAPDIPYDLDDIRALQLQVIRDRLKVFGPDHPQVSVVEDVPCAHPVDALTAASEGAGLLVVGSHGRGALGSALLGSVSRGVLHHARCPVAVVRA